jgi:hypothetical protein
LSDKNDIYQQWLPVVAKSLAHLCLQNSELKEALGIGRPEVAAMLGTTTDTVRVTLNKGKREKGGNKNAQKKRKQAGRR